MAVLLLGLVLFIGMHSIYIAAPAFRQAMIARMGYNPWRGVHSLVSLAGVALIVVGFGMARADPIVIWSPPFWTAHLTMTVMLLAFPVLLAAFIPSRIGLALKHPMLASVKIWAVAHLFANGTLGDILLFGGLLLWALTARVTLLRRPMTILAAPAAAPALVNDVAVVLLGLAVYAAFLFGLHGYVTGVPLL